MANLKWHCTIFYSSNMAASSRSLTLHCNAWKKYRKRGFKSWNISNWLIWVHLTLTYINSCVTFEWSRHFEIAARYPQYLHISLNNILFWMEKLKSCMYIYIVKPSAQIYVFGFFLLTWLHFQDGGPYTKICKFLCCTHMICSRCTKNTSTVAF